MSLLEYEAYGELAVAEGTKLVEEAKLRFGLDWAHAIHRVGQLAVGDVAVWIGCAAAHRKEAFLACEFLIDEIKIRLPIWKKEHYASGASEWINLDRKNRSSELTPGDIFQRQISMPEVGPAGQAALSQAKVLVVGAGGLANASLPYLASAGIGTIGIVEPDLLEPSNLHRQPLFSYLDIGRSKARLAAESIQKIQPFIRVQVFEELLSASNARSILEQFDIVIDGTDRFDVKFLMNDVCQELSKPFVNAAIYRLDGYIQTVLPGGPCLRCQWPDEPSDGCVKTCEEAGVLGVVPGLLGIMQAAEAIKIVLGSPDILGKTQLLIDLRDFSVQSLVRVKRENCSCRDIPPNSPNGKVPLPWEVTLDQVQSWDEPFICVDVREPEEERFLIDLGQQSWEYMPLNSISDDNSWPFTERVLLVCAKGIRSSQLAYRLRERDLDHVFSLADGLDRHAAAATTSGV